MKNCYHVYALITHPAIDSTHPCVLALPSEGGWVLPSFASDDLYHNDTKTINGRIRELLGFDVIMLRSVTRWREDLNEVSHRHTIYEMVLRDEMEPPTGIWASCVDLSLAPAQLESIIDGWFMEHERGVVSPWSFPGWFEQAVAWIDVQLASRNIERTGPVEQVRVWSLTAVLRVPTAEGDLFFKAVPPMFGREPALTEVLARQYPQHLPDVLATDPAQGWLLMRDFQAQSLSQVEDYAAWEAAIQRYARLQIDQIGQTESLLALGCADRRLNVLDSQIDSSLDSLPVLSAGHFTDEEMIQFRAAVPRLRDMIRELAAGPIPLSLVHGDFHANNLGVKHETGQGTITDRILYFDWTDGCIAHPFFDLAVFLEDSEEYYESFDWHEDAKARLQAAYLEPWAEFVSSLVPPETLRHLLTIAYPLGLLHQAVSYQAILEALEPEARWQFDFAPPFYLRLMLKYLP